jgi:prepilin-type N-terminal cleavage/methylation domain-containing protein
MRRLANGKRSARGGFTLIEVLLALAILLFGMSAVLGLFTFGAALSRSAHLRMVGSSAADAVVADLEETLFPLDAQGEAGEPRPIADRSVPGNPELVYSARATPNPDRPLEYKVEIRMRWSSAGVEREKVFTTILLREIPFGERLRRRFVEGLQPKPEEAPRIPSGTRASEPAAVPGRQGR